jgi:ribosomal protein S18 acetylase RimI-like enzyme
MDLVVEKARPVDFEAILSVYRLATALHRDQGLIQWDDEYPSPTTLKENLALGVTWVIRSPEGQIMATTTLDSDQEPQYEQIQWMYPAHRILVVHRLCVHPAYQGQGLAKKLMEFTESFAKDNDYEVIRFDAFLGNDASQSLYRNLGYHEAIGYCYYHPDQIMCNCFEKRII